MKIILNYTPLHAHLANGSIGDSILTTKDYIQKAKKLGMKSLSMTDHGSLSAMVDFYNECKNNNINPIIGCEVYTTQDRFNKDKDDISSTKLNHLVLLSKNETGYKNLLKIHNDAQINGFYYKPRTDYDFLSKHSEGIIALSACIGGIIPQSILDGDIEAAKVMIDINKKIFDDFYLEIQPGNFDKQIIVNKTLVELSKETQTPLVVTGDVHYLDKSDSIIHDLHVKLRRRQEDKKEMIYSDDCYYLMSYNEIFNRLDYLDKDSVYKALHNTNVIANQCNVNIDMSIKMPKFEMENNNAHDYLIKVLMAAFKEKEDTFTNPSLYMSRLLYELETITSKDFESYFLIIQDLVNFAKSNDISVGPGRGSAGGSLISYLLGITAVDPVKNNLMFERFLSPHREAIPDIDIDFDSSRRDEVSEYTKNKYGSNNCSLIGTFNMRKARSAIRDSARLFDIDQRIADTAAKLIPTVLYDSEGNKRTDLSIEDSIKSVPKLRQMRNKYKDWFNAAIKLEGLPAFTSTHAAGMIVSPEEILDKIPITYNKERDMYVTTLSMNDVEDMGFVKIDLLGLNTLSIIDKTLEESDVEFNFATNSFDDDDIWDLIGTKHLTGLFQISSNTYKARMHRLKPRNMDELVICLALLRGPAISSGADELYMDILAGKQDPLYVHNLYYQATKDTYGVLIFQEQLMQIAVNFGFSLEDGYKILKASAKKQFDVLGSYEKQFKENAVKLDVPLDVIDTVFKIIIDSGQYLFNIAHASCYAHVTYLSAYLKIHHPDIFMKNLLTNAYIHDTSIKEAIKDVVRMKVPFSKFDINKSEWEFLIDDDGYIIPGMCSIKAFGKVAAQEIIDKRPFKDFDDFNDRITKGNCKKNNIIAGIFAGLFDTLEPNMTREEIYVKYMETRKEDPLNEIKATNHAKSKKYKINDDYDKIEKLILQAPFTNMVVKKE